jgi:mono/diheme cytochrome c family protein
MSRSLRLLVGQLVPLAGSLLLLLPIAGCRQDMHDQPKFFPQRSTTFYADGRSVRPQVPGTVARSQAEKPSYFTTGLIEGGAEGDGLPFKSTPAVLQRGQERYNVYCTPCHSRVGNGKGMVVARGYYPATSFHTYRLRSAPLGHFFSVITNGYGAMPDYAAQITPSDRWAIAAYIRVLQLSQNAATADVPAGTKVQPISALQENSGFSEGFLGDWLGASAQHVHPATETAPAPAAAIAPAAAPLAPVAAPSTVPALAATTPNAKVGPARPGRDALATRPVQIASAAEARPPAAAAQDAAPAKAEPTAKPAAAGNAVHGHAVYSANCAVCHQPTRAGMPPVFPSLIGVVDRVGEKRVRTVAREGIPDAKPPMPPHPNLTDQDISDLLSFLKTKP